MKVLEQFVMRNAKRIKHNGEDVLVTDGDPLLVEGFKELGWKDPHPLPVRATEDAKRR